MNYFVPFEIAAYLMFAALFLVQFKKKPEDRNFFILFAGLAFGILLEIADIAIWHTYSYGNVFFVYVFNVPLAIGVAWAVILHISMLVTDKIGDKYNINVFVRPLMDALLVFSIDIVLDVVSVTHGGWSWIISSNSEWFGVPYENFVGWMTVALVFSLIVRIVRLLEGKLTKKKTLPIFKQLGGFAMKLATPFVSYVVLFVLFLLQATVVNVAYFIEKNNFAYYGSMLAPKVIYDPAISTIKCWLFISIVFILLFVFFYNLYKKGVLKKKNLDLNLIDPKFFNKDAELFVSFVITMVITTVILISLFLGEPYNSYLLIVVQLSVIALNFFAFLVAFNAGKKTKAKAKR